MLTELAAGSYTVRASDVIVGSVTYSASPPTQSVAVGGSTSTAVVLYSSGAGTLDLTINGLGTSGDAAVTVTGPENYSRNIPASQTLVGLTPGTYTISALDVVATGGTPHTPTPATQQATVSAVGTATASVTYAPPSTGPLNLRVAGLYLTQSAQTYDGSVPLVKGRDGYLRVFAVANRTNTAAPFVRIRIYDAGNSVVSTILIPPPAQSVPTSVDESALIHSWNTAVSGAFVQPGFRMEAEVDATSLVLESNEGDNLLMAPAAVVHTVPPLNLTFVPVIQQRHAARGDVGNVTTGNTEDYLWLSRRMHPLSGFNVTVRAPYTTSTLDTLQRDNRNSAWTTILNEIEAIRVVEKPSGYYYGVAKVSYSSGVAGVAFVSNGRSERSALGWDRSSGASVFAHELGHNWGRHHAPCGGPGGVDAAYPHSDGRIGVFGYDVAEQTLKPASTSDIMGYCEPKWIGDYTYKAIMSYLMSPPLSVAGIQSAASGSVQPSLLVWGHMRDGEMVLEPAFHVNTRPKLPRGQGDYTVEAHAEDGTNLFRLSFTPSQVADAPGSEQSFVFAVPLSEAQAARIATLRLTGRGREAVRKRATALSRGGQFSAAARSEPPRVRQLTGGKVGVQWDAGAHPMVMVRDAETGEVLSFARGGSIQLASNKREVDLVLSDGVRSRVSRVRVEP
jgi:hypothetical protein